MHTRRRSTDTRRRPGPRLAAVIAVAWAALAHAQPNRPAQMIQDDKLYPLTSDFDANGIHECLLVTRTERRDNGGAATVTTTLTLLEPIAADSRVGLRRDGHRFRHLPGGQTVLADVEPVTAGFAEHAFTGSGLTRYGMFSLVVLPVQSPVGGRAIPIRIYNTARGAFRFDLGEDSFELVGDPTVRRQFLGALASMRRPSAIQIAGVTRVRPGPLP